MPEQLLHVPQLGAVPQGVGSEGMPQAYAGVMLSIFASSAYALRISQNPCRVRREPR